MPWLTPDSIPEDDDCRPLSIPASTDWLALVSGALTELTKPYNWQQGGALTVQETVDKMQSIVDAYYSSPCAMCMTPGGYRVVRISPGGHVEELDPSGNWVDGTDEYHIPPPEARTDGTPPDQICLAAKNAVNVLEQLYENLTDSWNNDLDDAEAVTAFILGAIALVGFEFAPITWGIVAFLTPVFTALYSALEFLGADLWDDNVSKQITCFLVDCALNTDGVVTFDWDCFNAHLNSLADDFGLGDDQLRLYLQIGFMLYFIGGVDGLNLAGRTTEITDDECLCDNGWCYRFADGAQLADWDSLQWAASGTDTPATYVGGAWLSGYNTGGHNVNFVHIRWENMTTITIDDAAAFVEEMDVQNRTIWINGDGTTFSGTQVWENGVWFPSVPVDVDSIDVVCWRTIDIGVNPFSLVWVQESNSTDENPYGSDNCP